MRTLVLLLIVLLPQTLWAQDVPRQITVTATGTVQATPDMAVVQIGVSREARLAKEAMDAASAAAAEVLAAVEAAGIEPRDVQTAGLSLNPVWEQGNARPPQVRGYVATNMLSVRVRDLASVGGLLDRLVGDGANRLNGLSFAVAEPEPLEREARAAAVEAARQKAETLAGAAGVTLGPVQQIHETDGGAMPAPMLRSAAMEASVPIAAGELEISVGVTVVFAIGE